MPICAIDDDAITDEQRQRGGAMEANKPTRNQTKCRARGFLIDAQAVQSELKLAMVSFRIF